MSNFTRRTKNPASGEFEDASWIDHGHKGYEVRFPSGNSYRQEAVAEWEFEGAPADMSNAPTKDAEGLAEFIDNGHMCRHGETPDTCGLCARDATITDLREQVARLSVLRNEKHDEATARAERLEAEVERLRALPRMWAKAHRTPTTWPVDETRIAVPTTVLNATEHGLAAVLEAVADALASPQPDAARPETIPALTLTAEQRQYLHDLTVHARDYDPETIIGDPEAERSRLTAKTDAAKPSGERFAEAEALLPYTWRSQPDFDVVVEGIAKALDAAASFPDYSDEVTQAHIDKLNEIIPDSAFADYQEVGTLGDTLIRHAGTVYAHSGPCTESCARPSAAAPDAAKPVHLFTDGAFVAHSGETLPFKIDCDALTDADLATLAAEIARTVNFSTVIGIPRGGLRLQAALTPYLKQGYGTLIVDDVLTTGRSMEDARKRFDENARGVVLFARGPCPSWITPLFTFFHPSAAAPQPSGDSRECTCHPSEAPVPCARRFALNECIAYRDGVADERQRCVEILRDEGWVGRSEQRIAHPEGHPPASIRGVTEGKDG